MSANVTLKKDIYPLLKLAYPLALMGLVQSAVWFFETIFLAQLGAETLAAGSLVSWLFGTMIVIIFGTLGALNILIAHKHGEKDEANIAWLARDGLWLAVLLSPFTIILFWNIAPIFLWFHQSPTVVQQANAYLHALSWSILPDFLMMACLEVAIGLGRTRVVLVFSIISVSLNILFSYLFIFGKYGFPALHIAGAGWGLAVSYIITALILFIFIYFNQDYRKYFRLVFSLQKPKYLGELLHIGVPLGFMYCVEVAFFFALTLVMGIYGSEIQAANQVALQYMTLCMSVMFAIAQAVTVRMGHLLGAKNIQSAIKVNSIGVCIGLVLMAIAAVFYVFFPELLISIDMNVTSQGNLNMIGHIKQFLLLCACFQFIESTRIILFGSLRALKETKFTLITSIISFWFIALPVGYVLSTVMQLYENGYWLGMILGAGLSVGLLQWRLKYKLKAYSHL